MKIETVKLKIKHISVNQAQEDGTTYHGHAQLAQLPRNDSKGAYWVIGLRCRCGRIKIAPTNVNQMEWNRNAYLGHAHVIRSIRRPKKGIKRLEGLTFKCRMQGESRRNVEDYG